MQTTKFRGRAKFIVYVPGIVVSILLMPVTSGFSFFYTLWALYQWYTTVYKITDRAIYVRKGLINYDTDEIKFRRTLDIDVKENLWYRIFGLEKVKFFTYDWSRRTTDSGRYWSRGDNSDQQESPGFNLTLKGLPKDKGLSDFIFDKVEESGAGQNEMNIIYK